MKRVRFGLIIFVCMAVIMCSSCQGRVTSSPQAVETPQPTQEVTQAPSQVPADITPEPPTPTPVTPSSDPISATVAPIGYGEAVEAVLAKHVGGLPLKCSLDYDDGLLLYEVEVLGGDGVVYEVQVDASNGTIMRTVADDDPSEYTAAMVTVPYTQAVTTAMDSLGQCTFDSFEIDTNAAGVVVYDVDLLDAQNWEQEIEVDAATGAIVSGAQTAPNPAANGAAAAATHHRERHHDETLAENMVISIDDPQPVRQFAVCSRCNQYPCVCSSAGTGNQVSPVCGTCHQNPCICSSSGSTSVSAAASTCGTCHRSPCVCGRSSSGTYSGSSGRHHGYSGHHSSHHSGHHG